MPPVYTRGASGEAGLPHDLPPHMPNNRGRRADLPDGVVNPAPLLALLTNDAEEELLLFLRLREGQE